MQGEGALNRKEISIEKKLQPGFEAPNLAREGSRVNGGARKRKNLERSKRRGESRQYS